MKKSILLTVFSIVIILTSCEKEKELSIEPVIVKKESLFLGENKVEIEFYEDIDGNLVQDEISDEVIKDYLISNPNSISVFSQEDKMIHIFKSKEEVTKYLLKEGAISNKTKGNDFNQLSKTLVVDPIFDDSNNVGGYPSVSEFASLRVYEHNDFISQLDNFKMYNYMTTSPHLLTKNINYFNSKNMNDKISSFKLDLYSLPPGVSGVLVTFFQHNLSGYQFGSTNIPLLVYVNLNNPTFHYAQLQYVHMSGALWWSKSFNDQISSYKVELL